MATRLILLIMLCFVVSIGIVLVLVLLSNDMRQHPGSFLRELPPHPVIGGDSLNIKHNTYYIAGGTPTTVYFGNYRSPLHVLEVNLTTLDTQHVWLNVKGIFDQKFWSARVNVDSPYFYVTDGAVPRIYSGTVATWCAERHAYDTVSYFRDIVPIHPDRYILKTLRGANPENVLGCLSADTPHFIYDSTILKKQVDGLFCTDGMLHYSDALSCFVYVYYYRNEFFVIDTALRVTLSGQTLDTTHHARLTVATSEPDGRHVLAAPPVFVNKKSSVSGTWLFINSSALARNQPEGAFEQGEIIDVYSLRSSRYAFSFYIFNYWQHKRMTEFAVFGDKLVVVYDDLIRVYTVIPTYFTDP